MAGWILKELRGEAGCALRTWRLGRLLPALKAASTPARPYTGQAELGGQVRSQAGAWERGKKTCASPEDLWVKVSPEAGGEGVEEAAGFSMHNSLKSGPLFPLSPNGGEGRGEGEVIFPEEK